MKYFEFTESEINEIKSYLPSDIAFGFLSYNRWFVSEESILNIDSIHGNLLTLSLEKIFNQTREDVLNSKESTSYENFVFYDSRAEIGFDAYKNIIGDIVSLGGLSPSLDSAISSYSNNVTTIRMLLKDGLFEMCYRYFLQNIKGNSILPNDDYVEDVLRNLCIQTGTSSDILFAIENLPNI